MNWLQGLWRDERGAVLSAEVVTVGTIAVLGSITGLSVAANAVDGEMKEFAFAIRSLDQSYAFNGHRSCGAYTAGSCYTQRDVQESIQALCADPSHPGESSKTDGETPTPIVVPTITEEAAPKPNQLPEPVKKSKKKPKEKRDDGEPQSKAEKSNNPTKPPQSRSERDNDA